MAPFLWPLKGVAWQLVEVDFTLPYRFNRASWGRMTATAPQKDSHRDELTALLACRPLLLVGMMGSGKTRGPRPRGTARPAFRRRDDDVEKLPHEHRDLFATAGASDFRAG